MLNQIRDTTAWAKSTAASLEYKGKAPKYLKALAEVLQKPTVELPQEPALVPFLFSPTALFQEVIQHVNFSAVKENFAKSQLGKLLARQINSLTLFISGVQEAIKSNALSSFGQLNPDKFALATQDGSSLGYANLKDTTGEKLYRFEKKRVGGIKIAQAKDGTVKTTIYPHDNNEKISQKPRLIYQADKNSLDKGKITELHLASEEVSQSAAQMAAQGGTIIVKGSVNPRTGIRDADTLL